MLKNIRSIFKFKFFYKTAFVTTILGLLTLLFDFGFSHSLKAQKEINAFYFVVLIIGVIATIFRYFEGQKKLKTAVIVTDFVVNFGILGLIFLHFFGKASSNHLFYNDNWVKFAIIFSFIREFAAQNINFKRTVFNPAQLFIVSFFLIILLGSLLLMLPKATYQGISFVDALFTSTSAVCVTGLIVVDTSTYFTHFGQVIIIVLIQIGGLGILTFASYFSYFFKGGSSYENQLVLTDITNSNKIGEVFATLKKILIITFLIEVIGALLIYLSIEFSPITSLYDKIFFAVFHSISAFCNAGFSTLSNGLYETGFRFNYFLQIVIILLFVLGGLGFPIVINILKYLKYLLLNRILNLRKEFRPRLLNVTSKITLITTFALIVLGTLMFFLTEYNNTLAGHVGFGKFVTALFGATTPRTAGFNTVDMMALNFSTLMITILLMWIGASPASTGGGIKTSTFAIATLNFLSLARGKERIEVYRREIANISVMRAFAIISLSLLIIGFGIFLISIFNEELDLMSIAFECFSAYSTVGLSIGVTPLLTLPSKLIIICIMFIGRVSILSILIALFKKAKYYNYRYPSEEIIIN